MRQTVHLMDYVDRSTYTLAHQEFTDCDLIGPALLLPSERSTFMNCLFHVYSPDPFTFPIAVTDCTFLDCRFVRIGLIPDSSRLEPLS